MSSLLVPATALIFRSEGLRIGTVGNGNRAALVPITVGRDFGNEIEVVSGLSDDAWVIVTPPDSLVDGQVVRVQEQKAAAGSQKAQPGSPKALIPK